MKTIKKITSLALAVLILMPLTVFSAISTSAIVEIRDGDYSYTVNSDSTYSLYHYYGNDTDITLPSKVFDTAVTSVYTHAFETSAITSVIIPEGYISIEGNAFFGCESLSSVTFPTTLKTLGNMAFGNCAVLEKVDLSETLLTAIPPFAFSGDTSLGEIILPESITTVGKNALSETAITEINLSENMTEIAVGAFMSCASLSKIDIPEKITKINDDTFNGCVSLENISFPKALKSIGDNAFKDCKSLTFGEFPSSLTKIGTGAFENDSALTELFIPESVTSIGAYALYPMSIQKTLKVTCYKDSYAAEYCYENLVEYTEVEKLFGDVNLDGVTNILDVTCIQKYKIGEEEIPSFRAKELADVNKDGEITIRDATLIQMKLAKIIDDF
jgi:hypothetical protein